MAELPVGGKDKTPMLNIRRGTVVVASKGPEGNIFHILGAVQKELRKQKWIGAYNELWERVQESGSYAEAVKIIREYVDLIDRDGEI